MDIRYRRMFGLASLFEGEVQKISIALRNDSQSDILKRCIKECFSGVINIHRTSRRYLEITSARVDKSQAVTKILAGLGITRFIAVGDGENDVATLKLAGLGFAVEGSPAARSAPELRRLKSPVYKELSQVLRQNL